MAHEKILVIDDSLQIRDFLTRAALPHAGYSCVSASDGRAGLEMLGKEKPDLVLTDMQMPRMSGLEVLQLLAQYKVDIPVVMMTAHGSETVAIEAFRLGVKDYLVKPFTVQEVLTVIERALTETRLRREKEVLTRRLAIANTQLERRVQEMAVLARVGQAVSALLEQRVLMKRVVEAAVFIVGAARGALLLVDKEGAMRLSTTFGFSAEIDDMPVSLSSSIASVISSKKPLRLDGANIKREPYGRDAPSPQAFLATPIIAQGETIGVLAVDRTQAGRAFNDNDARLLAALADYAAISLQNARLFEEAARSRYKLEAVIKHTADGVIVLNPRGEVLLANPAAEALLGARLPADRLLFSSTSNDALKTLMKRAGMQNKAVTQEVVGASGKTLNANISPAPELGFVVMLHDITMLKELERIRREREQAENDRLRESFQRYVPPGVVEQLTQSGSNGLPPPESREVIALSADLRGFGALLERLPAETLINDVLNRFLSTVGDIVLQHGGTIDKFVGAGMLAIFGWPLAGAGDAERAITSAVEMQGALRRLREQWHSELGVNIGIGIGIGHGTVIAGSIGSQQRQQFTVIGEAVLLAQELNRQAHAGEVLMSRSVVDLVREPLESVAYDDFPPVRINGDKTEHDIVLVRQEATRQPVPAG